MGQKGQREQWGHWRHWGLFSAAESEKKEKPLPMRIAHYPGIKIDEEFMQDIAEKEEGAEENYFITGLHHREN